MKKHTIIQVVSLWVVGALLGGSQSFAETSADYVSVPPFVTSGAPPLVMLVMGRNHKLYYEAYNDASDLNDDGVLDVRYSPADIEYYGYFDSYKCYKYNTSLFEPTASTTDKKCSGADEWSGDFLNYVTMTRMDTMRKVLYGGYRSTDSSTETVLQRVFVPQDAHSWGKEYTSIAVDGYDIADYTPFVAPAAGLRHLFASTTLVSANDPPLMRVALGNTHRIWQWVAKESPVADNSIVTSAGGHPGHPGDHAAFENMVNTYALPAYYYGESDWLTYADRNHQYQRFPSPDATTFGAIDGAGNPWGDNYDPYSSGATEQENYLAIFTGQIHVTAGGTYTFGVNGDDATEVLIDGVQVAGRYGPNGSSGDNPPLANTGTVTFADDSTHDIEFRMEEAGGGDQYYLYWNGPDSGNNWTIIPNTAFTSLHLETYSLSTPASTIVDYAVRVKVCDPNSAAGLEPNCKEYPDGNFKPTGLLQRHGENEQMYFGLLSGSYAKNTSGGVLRKRIGSIKDEIIADTGQIQPAAVTNGIIQTINKFRIYGYDYGSRSYNQNCGWITNGPMTEGHCRDWGNPIAEMMYETQRYFAGKGAPTAGYTYSGTTDDSNLGLPLASWNDPYDLNDDGFENCSKPFMLVLSDINPTYDSDSLPGVDSNFGSGITGDLTGLNVKNLADEISTEELITGDTYIGQSGADGNGACTVKDINGFGDIRGLCPEEPTKGGGYYSAAVAYYGHENDLNSTGEGDQKVRTYAVGLASPLPRIELEIGGHPITLVPFAKTIGSYNNSQVWNYWPTNTIVDFFVDTLTSTSGTFRINFEDVEQGADHDQDAIFQYTYQLVDDGGNSVTDPADATSVNIGLFAESASGDYIQHAGYIISGTDGADGTYLDVTDDDTPDNQNFLVVLDTPPGVSPLPADDTSRDTAGETHDTNLGVLPKSTLTTPRNFRPDTSGNNSAATLLENPLWYAAKWGAFDDLDDDATPMNADGSDKEWDKDDNGIPDTYFYVSNPLRLEEQLNASFADMLNVASSGTAASVISNTRSGEGAVYQSMFFPKLESGGQSLTWVGELHSLFTDDNGNMREDTNGNKQLNLHNEDINNNGFIESGISEDLNGNYILDAGEDLNHNGKLDTHWNEDLDGDGVLDTRDYIVVFGENADGSVNVKTYDDVDEDGVYDTYIATYSVSSLDPAQSIKYLWRSSDYLNNLTDPLTQRAYTSVATDKRYIFTFVDNDQDGIKDAGEQISFDISNKASLYPYLTLYPSFTDKPQWVKDIDFQGVTDAVAFRSTQAERVIKYIRGEDQGSYTQGTAEVPAMRNRQYADPVTSLTKTWRLGDIVHSSPTLVGRPQEGYQLLYRDFGYAEFLEKYQQRRSVVYTGANDGMIHAFNAGFYDSETREVLTSIPEPFSDLDGDGTRDNNEPFVDRNGNNIYDEATQTEYALGSEMWAYIPYNLLPHLYWLTETEYLHVYYNDLTPKVFDAQIFNVGDADPEQWGDTDHPNGWGTVMVVGMRLGGGVIRADSEKDDTFDNSATGTDREMHSALVVFDITNPEVAPKVLAEIALPGQGYTTCYPSVIPMKSKRGTGNSTTFNSNDWYLVYGSGPADSSGVATSHRSYDSVLSGALSKQSGKLFVLDLKKMTQVTNPVISTIAASGTPTTTAPFYIQDFEANSFVSQPITVDYNLDFNADTVYFGTISGPHTNADGDTLWAGQMRRLLVDNEVADSATGSVNWTGLNFASVDRADNTLIDLSVDTSTFFDGQPITAAATVTVGDRVFLNEIATNVDINGDGTISNAAVDVNGDGVTNDFDRERWVFFGTGRYIVKEDTENDDQQSYYGIKEPLAQKSDGSYGFSGETVDRDELLDVTDGVVYDENFSTNQITVNGISGVTNWDDLVAHINVSKGWYKDFPESKERNLGQATLLGGLLVFTTYIPGEDICSIEGESWLSALYYSTGTAFYESVMGYDVEDKNSDSILDPGEKRMRTRFRLGKGLALTPNVHTGREEGSKVYVQTSTGAIKVIEQDNPGLTKSGKTSWRLR